MPMPGPLGRLVRRKRAELGLTQQALSERTSTYGPAVPQNIISRLESGRTQRMHKIAYLNALARALGLEGDREFILTAYGSPIGDDQQVLVESDGSIIRIVRDVADLDDDETEQLRHFIEHVRQTPETATGPSPEERIANFTRRLLQDRDGHATPATAKR
jgi:transcriptional regulator with XRE-family HTH domain